MSVAVSLTFLTAMLASVTDEVGEKTAMVVECHHSACPCIVHAKGTCVHTEKRKKHRFFGGVGRGGVGVGGLFCEVVALNKIIWVQIHLFIYIPT